MRFDTAVLLVDDGDGVTASSSAQRHPVEGHVVVGIADACGQVVIDLAPRAAEKLRDALIEVLPLPDADATVRAHPVRIPLAQWLSTAVQGVRVVGQPVDTSQPGTESLGAGLVSSDSAAWLGEE